MKNAYNTSAYGSFAYVYDIFMDNKYVVVRKGYEHPEIVWILLLLRFYYSLFL